MYIGIIWASGTRTPHVRQFNIGIYCYTTPVANTSTVCGICLHFVQKYIQLYNIMYMYMLLTNSTTSSWIS